MAKNIFNPIDIIQDPNIAYISAPTFAPGVLNVVEEVELPTYEGPTADELRAEAEEFKAKWEVERKAMMEAAQKEAAAIIQDASEKAQAMASQVESDISSQKSAFDQEHAQILEKASLDAEQIKERAESQIEHIHRKAHDEGFDEGKTAGYQEGYSEAERLIERLHTIINRTVDKRNDILEEVETQVVELALLMVRKVVKVIAENQKTVVINNIIQALRKMKSRSDVTIRVNIDDLKMASDHKEDFVKNIEGGGKINFIEDSAIEAGGCIVETDFGEIDARISSQLSEIENRIRDLMPISIRPKNTEEDESLYGQ